MGVQTEVQQRERRSVPQEEMGSVKRFKPTPVLGGPGDEATPSLKIRFSRYGNTASPPPPTTAQTDAERTVKPKEGEEVEEEENPPAPSTAVLSGSPRLTRGRTTTKAARKIGPTSPNSSPVKAEMTRQCEVRVTSVKVEDGEFKPPFQPSPRINSDMCATDIVTECERVGPGLGPISTSVLDEGQPCPMPKRRDELPKLTPSQMLPPTPCVHVKNKQEAFSPQLLDWCLQRPITVIRGMAQACDLDLSLYTTKSLTEAHPNHPVEIRTQLEQSSDENWDPTLRHQVWYCTSSRSHTTIAKYAEYLATSYKEAKDKLGKDFSVNPKLELRNDPETGLPVRKTIKFGTNCDLSDEKKWKPQIQELMKLPCWLRVVSAGNMLSHIGHQILGMNTIQLYMKVPRSRTPGHQENNNFAAVNINIGPGDSEWFGVPDSYWGALQELCEKNKVDYLHGSWWPSMEDLKEMGIPCYRFMQRPGELVWVNTGCVHWVQAAGWCNNVAWNTGPLTYRQYRAAIERYEWNKSQRYQSIVAMVFLTWNMARNIRVTDVNLYRAMKTTMMRSLRQSTLMKIYALERDVPVRFHGHGLNEPVNYCMMCEEEVFNIFFIRSNEKKHVVHCLRCARQSDNDLKGWICLEEYDIEELKSVFDSFTLGDLTTMQTGENPLKLALVNNNSAC